VNLLFWSIWFAVQASLTSRWLMIISCNSSTLICYTSFFLKLVVSLTPVFGLLFLYDPDFFLLYLGEIDLRSPWPALFQGWPIVLL
jgi:hypothetical protein